MADQRQDQPLRTAGAQPTHIHIEKKKTNWLALIAVLLGLLALLWYLLAHRHHEAATVTVPVTTTTHTITGANPSVMSTTVIGAPVALPGGKSVTLAPGTLNYQVNETLSGVATLPRTLTFDRLNFDTAKAEIRSEDRPQLDDLAQILTAYPNSRVRIVGYTDSVGTPGSNAQLGADRAKAVAHALIAKGIVAGRIETSSGGESAPVESNATTGGRAENRRTELVVLAR